MWPCFRNVSFPVLYVCIIDLNCFNTCVLLFGWLGWVYWVDRLRFLQVKAKDADGGSFGSVSYSLGSGPGSLAPPHFTINKETGQICTTAILDRDQGPASYDFVVTAVDGVSQFNVINQHQIVWQLNMPQQWLEKNPQSLTRQATTGLAPPLADCSIMCSTSCLHVLQWQNIFLVTFLIELSFHLQCLIQTLSLPYAIYSVFIIFSQKLVNITLLFRKYANKYAYLTLTHVSLLFGCGIM